MSKNIEELFKQSLENHEESYDPNAWETLQSRLDSEQKTNRKTNSSKWKTISIILVGLSVASYFKFSLKDEESHKYNSRNNINLTENKEIKLTTEPKSKTNFSKKYSTKNKPSINQIKPSALIEKSIEKNPEFKSIENHIDQKETNKTLHITSKSTYCQGEIEGFKNDNEFTIYLIHESGKFFSIKKDETKDIELNDLGTYYWSFENSISSDNKLKGFEVISSPKINFTLPEDIDLSNGLPIISLTSNQNGNNKWFVNNKPYGQGKDIDMYAFLKGKYEIKLINELYGCKSELTKSFYANENYNLMSVTGIDPNHPDPKRNSFIPYALFLRKTEFRMFIITPNTGEIIFETNDLDNPWKGRNEKTDELVPENSEYIWKVIISNPAKGEKSEYKGRITRI